MDYNFLANTSLFRGISPEEIKGILNCFNAKQSFYAKSGPIYRAGDIVRSMGLVLFGSVNIESDNIWGNTAILDHIGPGQVFAESYACLPGEPMNVNVIAVEKSKILFLNTDRMFQCCKETCPHHIKLIRNMLTVSAKKNLNLSRRIFHTSAKTIRGRLLSYLSFQVIHTGSYQFTIPFNRQQLADYLGVDRSALSNEMGKMRDEGLISFDKNYFEIQTPPAFNK